MNNQAYSKSPTVYPSKKCMSETADKLEKVAKLVRTVLTLPYAEVIILTDLPYASTSATESERPQTVHRSLVARAFPF